VVRNAWKDVYSRAADGDWSNESNWAFIQLYRSRSQTNHHLISDILNWGCVHEMEPLSMSEITWWCRSPIARKGVESKSKTPYNGADEVQISPHCSRRLPHDVDYRTNRMKKHLLKPVGNEAINSLVKSTFASRYSREDVLNPIDGLIPVKDSLIDLWDSLSIGQQFPGHFVHAVSFTAPLQDEMFCVLHSKNDPRNRAIQQSVMSRFQEKVMGSKRNVSLICSELSSDKHGTWRCGRIIYFSWRYW
jgi:hypothetical protein